MKLFANLFSSVDVFVLGVSTMVNEGGEVGDLDGELELDGERVGRKVVAKEGDLVGEGSENTKIRLIHI